MAGIRLSRGPWQFRTMSLTAASNFSQGTLVKLSTARTVSEYSGGEDGYLGVAMAASLNSLPAGKLVVAIPAPGCTAYVDVPTGITASSLSFGEKYGLYGPGGPVSAITTSYTSEAARIVSIVGTLDSASSTIEVTFIQGGNQYNSIDSTPIA